MVRDSKGLQDVQDRQRGTIISSTRGVRETTRDSLHVLKPKTRTNQKNKQTSILVSKPLPSRHLYLERESLEVKRRYTWYYIKVTEETIQLSQRKPVPQDSGLRGTEGTPGL